MASLKELKGRISSVKSTQKITKAKQMVAAAKLRRAQEAAEASRPYAQRLAAVIANLSAAAGEGSAGPKLLAGTGEDKTHLLLIMTAERGLCGGFNGNIAKLAKGKTTGTRKAGFASTVRDFYLTNPIARASKTMAECSALAQGGEQGRGEQGGTGTDG